jgi:hypothetical protein
MAADHSRTDRTRRSATASRSATTGSAGSSTRSYVIGRLSGSSISRRSTARCSGSAG